MIRASKLFQDYQQKNSSFFVKETWTAVYTFMLIGYVLFVGACITCFCVLSCNLGLVLWEWQIITFLACILIIATTIVLIFKFYLPYFIKKAEDVNNRGNKLLSMVQEEYENENLAEKTSIGIIEKYAKAIIEEEARNADSHRQQAVKQQEFNSKVADVTCDLLKAYISAQSPQTISDEQIVYQLIQSLTNKNK